MPDAVDFPENHPEYDRGFDNGWHAGRRDAFAIIHDTTHNELSKIGAADAVGHPIPPVLTRDHDNDTRVPRSARSR